MKLPSISLCLALALLAGCSSGEQRTTVVLIDRSGSISPDDRSIYMQSLEAVAGGIEAGERVLVAPIGDADRSQFRALYDHRSAPSDRRLEQEHNIKEAREDLAQALPALLPEDARGRARSTRILAAIAAAAQAFAPADDDGDQLFILSDGIEEGSAVNLTRLAGSPEAIAAALEKARQQDLLPDLAGVKLYLIGTGGDTTPGGVKGVAAFWHAYAKATGATIAQIGRLPYAPA